MAVTVPFRHGDRLPAALDARFCGVAFSGLDVESTLRYLESRTARDPFAYIVTPNVDHVVRLWRAEAPVREAYEDADLSLCDSRILGGLARACGVSLPIVTGSDLTAILFRYFLGPYDRIVVIGGAPELVAQLRRSYGLREVRHHNPPMGFIRDPKAVAAAAEFIERWPARWIFLAVGSPQQELLANAVKRRGRATGTALCIGASLQFLTGDLRRAPEWMQRTNLEWLHRLATEPLRLWHRYLVEGPAIFRIAAEHVKARHGLESRGVQISVVIPTFRREHLLPRLLQRCAAQEGLAPDGYEVVVVDNTPESTARVIVTNLAARAPVSIRYVHEPRAGISHARNRGIAEAQGELIAFIDDDEIPSPGWLAALMRTQQTFRADVVLGPVRPVFEAAPQRFLGLFRAFFTQSSDADTGTRVSPNTPFRLGSRGACYRAMASNNALMVRSRCFTSATPFDPGLGLTGGEDTLFFMQLHMAGRHIVWCREALVHERVPKERLTGRFLLRRKFRDGQITSSTCLMVRPRRLILLLVWLAVGTIQIAAGTILAVLALPFDRARSLKALTTAATGLGKLAFFGHLKQKQYGADART
jgi:exopolysaccharide biosynthesis WecB/TagA/CpsF family protein